jgi:hypothetical protein
MSEHCPLFDRDHEGRLVMAFDANIPPECLPCLKFAEESPVTQKVEETFSLDPATEAFIANESPDYWTVVGLKLGTDIRHNSRERHAIKESGVDLFGDNEHGLTNRSEMIFNCVAPGSTRVD